MNDIIYFQVEMEPSPTFEVENLYNMEIYTIIEMEYRYDSSIADGGSQ